MWIERGQRKYTEMLAVIVLKWWTLFFSYIS